MTVLTRPSRGLRWRAAPCLHAQAARRASAVTMWPSALRGKAAKKVCGHPAVQRQRCRCTAHRALCTCGSRPRVNGARAIQHNVALRKVRAVVRRLTWCAHRAGKPVRVTDVMSGAPGRLLKRTQLALSALQQQVSALVCCAHQRMGQRSPPAHPAHSFPDVLSLNSLPLFAHGG